MIRELLVIIVTSVKFTLINFIILSFFLFVVYLITLKQKLRRSNKDALVITFIHPFCTDCGGGEKVLWRMLNAIVTYVPKVKTKQLHIKVLISGDTEASTILQKVKNVFSIDFQQLPRSSIVQKIELVRVKTDYMLKPVNFLTMLFQILGQIYFSFEILIKSYSDIYIDTTGYPFTYFFLYLFGGKIFSYVHYPFISVDMIEGIKKGKEGVYSKYGTKQKYIKIFKLFYYKMILKFYKLVGALVSHAYCNSTWTSNHMRNSWKQTPLETFFPPCSTSKFSELATNNNRENWIVSFSQFRPEKNHMMQIRIAEKLSKSRGKNGAPISFKLHMIGGVRNETDQKYFDGLKQEISKRNLNNFIELIPNASSEQLRNEFSRAKIGIHTMKDEHFGISIIEMMSAGLIVIAHNSAGAKFDIIGGPGDQVGFLVEDENGYVSSIINVLDSYNTFGNLRACAVKKADTFSDECFDEKFRKFFGEMIK